MAKLTHKSFDPYSLVQKQSSVTSLPIQAGGVAGGSNGGFGGQLDVAARKAREQLMRGVQTKVDPDFWRVLRLSIPWVATAVERRRDLGRMQRPDIGPVVPADHTEQAEAIAQQIRTIIAYPDPRGRRVNWGTHVSTAIEDFYIHGRAASRIMADPRTKIIDTIRNLDPARLEENPAWDAEAEDENPLEWDGESDEYAGVPRWFYKPDRNDKAGKPIPLASWEVLTFDASPVSYQERGLAPMQALIPMLLAQVDLFRAMHVSGRNLQPGAVLKIPNPAPGTVEEVEKQLRQKVVGKSGIAVFGIDAASELWHLGTSDVHSMGVYDTYDITVRAVSAVFKMSTTALSWTRTTLERTADQQSELDDEGGVNLLMLIAEAYTEGFVHLFEGADNLQLFYPGISNQESESVEVTKQKAGPFQVWTLRSIYEAAGQELPDDIPEELAPYFDWPVWPTGAGTFLPVPYYHALNVQPQLDQIAAQAAMPPQPPPEASQGQPPPPGGQLEPDNERTDENAQQQQPPGKAAWIDMAVNGARTKQADANGNGHTVPVVAGLRRKQAEDEEMERERTRWADEMDRLFTRHYGT